LFVNSKIKMAAAGFDVYQTLPKYRYIVFLLVIILVNQPQFKFRILCDILSELCGTNTAGTQSARRKDMTLSSES
jgi:hypothetical protein